ncbi:aminotransferase class III-fold pyridoxal phosphate-dependent enzyme [Bifidobacterium sp. SO1]|uniref:aspartate aminotransferase family protein n=1 Tax=Bifidobacterium sp. SO1 TaxID=2809029 RepID=UPI001BDCFA70|nr:aminotransferase class III-fold pyridoxal phosphate-dependent enzyme [Bifidobacterium sp. SO1]MBT1161511.1 aminotransferase class III-fold pyridoxal phosphate-dependent enzyme [Bifidobacterium sp. SO1]
MSNIDASVPAPVAGRKGLANGFDFSKGTAGLSPDTVALIERRKRTLGTLGPLFYNRPIHVVRGNGAHLFDADGVDYLDCYNNVACVGHANPHVREAVSDQLAKQDTHSRYLQDEVLDYAERLLSLFPEGLDRVSFTNSGSESNDLALRMARVYTGHQGVVVTANAYHGITALVSSVSPSFGTAIPLAPFLATVEVHDVLTGGMPADKARAVLRERFAAAFRSLHDAGYGVSAVLLDQIFSSDGVLPGAQGWVADIADMAHRAGGLLIADEVQSGFARTGDAFWGFQRHHADADLVTIGKPMGNGIPTGAVVYKAAIGDAFAACTRYFNTFGGNPVSMRAAEAVLDEIESRGLLAQAKTVGDYICDGFASLLAGRPKLGEIRHAGMFIGIDIRSDDGSRPDPAGTQTIVDALRDRNILISASGADGSALKVRPPLVFTTADADRLLDAVGELRDLGFFD